MKGNSVLYKTLVIGVIVLFIGIGIQPSVAVQPETEIDIEPKDYLFQTIIDFANNPDVKELLEHYDYDLFKFDIDWSIHRKLFLRNPRLMFNMIFSKPSMSVEYLNKCYNNGIRITNILGEDKVIETIENVEVTDTKLFDELNNIISQDEELSGRIATLKEMNKNIKLDWEDHPIICSIYLAIGVVSLTMMFIFALPLGLVYPFENFPILFDILVLIFSPFAFIFGIFLQILLLNIVFGLAFGCIPPPYVSNYYGL